VGPKLSFVGLFIREYGEAFVTPHISNIDVLLIKRKELKYHLLGMSKISYMSSRLLKKATKLETCCHGDDPRVGTR
jgi:hypothetical protein